MSILLISGSPSERSRTAVLLAALKKRLEAHGVQVDTLLIRDLSPQALILANLSHPSIANAISQVVHAKIVIIVTPIYKAAYSGVLKAFLDLLPTTAFKEKTVLPLAIGGKNYHPQELDYAIKPVLQALGAKYILPGIYVSDEQITPTPDDSFEIGFEIAQEIQIRLDEAVHTLIHEHLFLNNHLLFLFCKLVLFLP